MATHQIAALISKSCIASATVSRAWPARRALRVAALGCLLALILPLAMAAGPANSLSPLEEKAARAIVAAQLAAFAADDAKTAFALAAPQIQKIFKNPANFLAMVQIQYPVVYRPATVAYFKPEIDGDSVIMKVQMTDAKDGQWLAIYALQRPQAKDKNKAWRIAGCVVTSSEGRTA